MTDEEEPPPARIAHRGGNSRRALNAAIGARVDWIEVDLWCHYGRLIAQHDQPLWPLPLVTDGWRLHRAPERPLYLAEVIETTAGGPRLLLDLKGVSRRLPGAVVETLRRTDAVSWTAICGQDWPLLEAAARLEPSLRLIHSFGSPAQLDAMRRGPAGAVPITTASVAHTLLTPAVIGEFKQRDIAIFAWTVNEPARARELVELGVDGITSDRLDLLAGLPSVARGEPTEP